MTVSYVLTIYGADPVACLFTTTHSLPQWVGDTELDRAHHRLIRAGTGRTLLAEHWVSEADIVDLRNAIRAARERYDALDGCRRTGCENRTDAPDQLCTTHREVAEDVSARLRSVRG